VGVLEEVAGQALEGHLGPQLASLAEVAEVVVVAVALEVVVAVGVVEEVGVAVAVAQEEVSPSQQAVVSALVVAVEVLPLHPCCNDNCNCMAALVGNRCWPVTLSGGFGTLHGALRSSCSGNQQRPMPGCPSGQSEPLLRYGPWFWPWGLF